MSEPTRAMSEPPAPNGGAPPEPGWQRFIVPGLALVAILVALTAFVAWRQLNPATREYTGQRVQLVPEGGPPSPFQGFAIQPERPAPDFELTDQHGEPWRLADQRGTVTALFFGYTHCPDVCPTTLAVMDSVDRKLREQSPDEPLEMVFVSVDPERDSLERIRDYLAFFNPGFRGATGHHPALHRLTDQLGVLYAKVDEVDTALGYVVDHSAHMVLLDPQAQLRALFSAPHIPDQIAADIEGILANDTAGKQ